MATVTVKLNAKDGSESRVDITARFQTKNIGRDEMARAKRVIAESLADVVKDIPFSSFSVLNTTVK